MFLNQKPGDNIIDRILGEVSSMNLKFANGAATAAMVHLLNHETPNGGEVRNFEMEEDILYNGDTDDEFANRNALTVAAGSGVAVVGDSAGLPISVIGRGGDAGRLLIEGTVNGTSDALKMTQSAPNSIDAAGGLIAMVKRNAVLRNFAKNSNNVEVKVRFKASWQVYMKRRFWFNGWSNRSGTVTIDIPSRNYSPSAIDVSRARGHAINHFLNP